MSDELEDLDAATLRRLDLPSTRDSPQGLSDLRFAKVIIPVYVVNLGRLQHEPVTGTGNDARSLTARINERLEVHSMRYTYNSTGTAGNRLLFVERRDKVNRLFNRYVFDFTLAASSTAHFEIAQGLIGTANVNVQLAYPVILEPEWHIDIGDNASIDANDSPSIRADVVRIPI